VITVSPGQGQPIDVADEIKVNGKVGLASQVLDPTHHLGRVERLLLIPLPAVYRE
jgi:hypothetical protein